MAPRTTAASSHHSHEGGESSLSSSVGSSVASSSAEPEGSDVGSSGWSEVDSGCLVGVLVGSGSLVSPVSSESDPAGSVGSTASERVGLGSVGERVGREGRPGPARPVLTAAADEGGSQEQGGDGAGEDPSHETHLRGRAA